jgi:DNA-binding transcriptional MerR regulator
MIKSGERTTHPSEEGDAVRHASTGTDGKLYRIGELAKLAGVSARTIDYYTGLGLLTPVKRSKGNYRLYNDETLERIRRIEELKAQKYSLEEIKAHFTALQRISPDEEVTRKLTELQAHLTQVEREVKELETVLNRLKPRQAAKLFRMITPQTAACAEELLLLLGKSSNLM